MTEFDEMKKAWQAQPAVSSEIFEQVGSDVESSVDLLRSRLFRRDMVELAAAIFVVPIFLYWSTKSETWLHWAGCMVIVVACAVISGVLWWARRRRNIEFSIGTFRDYIDIEIESLRRQVKIISKVGWWYMGPLFVGVMMVCFGTIRPRDRFGAGIVIGVAIFQCAMFAWVWLVNRNACSSHLEPLLNHYQRLRHAIDEEDESLLPENPPPVEFLNARVGRPISRMQWRVGLAITIVGAVATVAAGIYLVREFDARTGWFVTSSAPVVAMLLVAMTGIWKRAFGFVEDRQ